MTIISKHVFDTRMPKDLPCSAVFHPWTDSCISANIRGFKILLSGITTFYLPIYVVKGIINYKKFKNKSQYTALVKELLRSIFYGLMLGESIMCFECILYSLFGPRYYLMGMAVGALSGWSLLVESQQNKILDTLIFCNLATEGFLRVLDYFKVFPLTNKNQTMLFSALSGCLMYLFKTRKQAPQFTHLWFYVPATKQPTKENVKSTQICPHKDNCQTYITQGITSYFVIGYTISTIKSFLGQFNKLVSRPTTLFSVILSRKNVRFGLFTATYAAIFRCISCYLTNKYQVDDPLYSAIAGLFAGVSFGINPNIQFLTIGLVTTIQLLYERLKKKFKIPTQLPVRQMMFMMSHAVLLHMRLAMPKLCPKFYRNFITHCSKGLLDEIYTGIVMNLF